MSLVAIPFGIWAFGWFIDMIGKKKRELREREKDNEG